MTRISNEFLSLSLLCVNESLGYLSSGRGCCSARVM